MVSGNKQIKEPKYSIIVPTYNGLQYLPTCIETITNQSYKDYELIISDDHSTDGTQEYLKTINHANIRKIFPPESLSMTEHWEWALTHAQGEWQIFVGQDDGLQPYFFKLADKLTSIARNKGLRTIMSTRAYFFWEGCEYVYGDMAIRYVAKNKFKVNNFKLESLKILLGIQTYFELPQMYTTALFSKGLIEEVRSKQRGKVFSCHPQDANLAAIASSLEKQYLKSYIPLGWVGSSPKSAGMAISGDSSKSIVINQVKMDSLKNEYLKKISKSKLAYHKYAGKFSFGNNAIYFWQALLMTSSLRSAKVNNALNSTFLKALLFSSVLYEINHSIKAKNKKKERFDDFKEILEVNNFSFLLINITYAFLYVLVKVWFIPHFLYRAYRKLYRLINRKTIKQYIDWSGQSHISMEEVSNNIMKDIGEKKWI